MCGGERGFVRRRNVGKVVCEKRILSLMKESGKIILFFECQILSDRFELFKCFCVSGF